MSRYTVHMGAVADNSVVASASVTAPGAGATLVSIAASLLQGGVYELRLDASVSNNAVADLGNMKLQIGGVDYLSPIPQGANGQSEEEVLRVALDGKSGLAILAIGAATAAIEYNVQIIATRVA